MPYQPILATLGYILSPNGENVLLIYRNARKQDHHLGKYNGLGGKLEPNEDVASGFQREIQEEAGITVSKMTLKGTISWPGFGKNGEDWFGFVFLVSEWTGEVLHSNPEGSLHWIPISQLLNGEIPLWDGDKHFLPLVFDPIISQFHGCMPYENGVATSWNYTCFPN